MTWAAQGDVVSLATAGTAPATGVAWRGGRGVLLITAPSGTPAMEIQAPDASWVPVKDINGTAVAAAATANMWNVELPAARVRLAAGGGAMNAVLVGV